MVGLKTIQIVNMRTETVADNCCGSSKASSSVQRINLMFKTQKYARDSGQRLQLQEK